MNLAEGIVKALRTAWDFLNKDVPQWLTDLLGTIGEILFDILKVAGQAYITQIEDKIMEISKTYPDASGDEKFNLVWEFAHTLLPIWKESRLDTLLQNLFIKLKEAGRL